MDTCSIALISRIRDGANHLIIDELKKVGLKELSPSHGDILMILFNSDNLSISEIAKKYTEQKQQQLF